MKSVFITREAMADKYGICVRTLNNRLKEKGITLKKGLISPKDQEYIYSNLGYPKDYSAVKREKKY